MVVDSEWKIGKEKRHTSKEESKIKWCILKNDWHNQFSEKDNGTVG